MSAEAGSLSTSVTEIARKASWVRDLLVAVVPSLFTAVFGFVIWNAQNTIQSGQSKMQLDVDRSNRMLELEMQLDVDRSNQMMQLQVAQKEEFYKRRLAIYDEACKNVAGVIIALDEAGVARQNETKAMNKLAELDRLNKSNALYWSEGLEKRLSAVWSLGIDKLRYQQYSDETANENIRSEITALHKQMKDDLGMMKDIEKKPEVTER